MTSKKLLLFLNIIWTVFYSLEIRNSFSQELPAVIPRVEVRPKIDGELNDIAWNSALRIELIRMNTGKPLEDDIRSQVSIAYDALYLYVSFFNRDPDISKLKIDAIEHDDNRVTKDDNVALYIKPWNKDGSFFRININAVNTTMDVWKPSKGLKNKIESGEVASEMVSIALAYRRPKEWQPRSLETATQINGDAWTVELKIAHEDLLQSDITGKIWEWNFARNIASLRYPTTVWYKVGRRFLRPQNFVELKFAE